MKQILFVFSFLCIGLHLSYAQNTQTVVLTTCDAGGKDGYTASDFPQTSYGTSSSLMVAGWVGPIGGYSQRSFLHFNMSAIPLGATITHASLDLYADPNSVGHIGSYDFFIHKVIANTWNENTLSWSSMPILGPPSTSVMAQFPPPYKDFTNIDVTNIIQDIVNNPPNLGIGLQLVNESPFRRAIFASNNHPDSSLCPRLTVIFQEPSVCDIQGCMSDTILLNTGYDHSVGTPYSYGSFDPFWTLIQSPDTSINLPRPAYVVPTFLPFQVWADQDNTTWITAYPHAENNANNPPPDTAYTFENCFCVCGDSTLVQIYMSVYCDDSVSINLVSSSNTIIAHLLDHNYYKYNTDPAVIDTAIYLNEGNYCISAELRNLGAVVMGLNVKGHIIGASLIDPLCCRNFSSSILGTKYHDRNCNGIRDSPNQPDAVNHEEVLSGWTIQLCDTNQNVISTTTTDQFGYYIFNDVSPGNYIVKEVQQTDWEATNIESQLGHQINLDTGQAVGNIDFANKYTGPVKLDSSLICAVSGDRIPIRWVGGECDCDIQLELYNCDDPVVSPITIYTDSVNLGSYAWLASGIATGNYQVKITAICDSTVEMDFSPCFEIIDFNVTASFDILPCGEVDFMAMSDIPVNFTWLFGDGSPYGLGANVTHTYTSGGTYGVTLIAETSTGCQKIINLKVLALECNPCGHLIDSISYTCSPVGSYQYWFKIINNSGVDVNQVILFPQSPINNISDSTFNVYLPDGDTSGWMHIVITPDSLITEPTLLCFDVVYIGGNAVCCKYEYCILVQPPDPCHFIDAIIIDSFENETSACCYEMAVINDYCDSFFIGITTTILTPEVHFDNPTSANNAWAVDFIGSQLVHWYPTGGYIPTDTIAGIEFCLSGVTSMTQVPQLVVFDYYALDPYSGDTILACSDTLEFECQPCMLITNDTITCNGDGTYNYTFTIKNNTATQTSDYWTVFPFPPNYVVFNPSLTIGPLPPLGMMTYTVNISAPGGGPLAPGTMVDLKFVLLSDTSDWCCHGDTLQYVLPPCDSFQSSACPEIVKFDYACSQDYNGDGLTDYDYILTIDNASGGETVLLSSSCGFMVQPANALSPGLNIINGSFTNPGLCTDYPVTFLIINDADSICTDSTYLYSVPDCDNIQPCLCDELAGQTNFTTMLNCNELTVSPNALLDCDSVVWSWGDSSTNSTSYGFEQVTHTYPQGTQKYQVCMTVYRSDDVGISCVDSVCYTISVDCLLKEIPSEKVVNLNKLTPNTNNALPQAGNRKFEIENEPLKVLEEPQLTIVPNPATNKVEIRMPYDHGQLYITGLNAQLSRNYAISSRSIELDISDLPSGIYVIRMRSGAKAIPPVKLVKM